LSGGVRREGVLGGSGREGEKGEFKAVTDTGKIQNASGEAVEKSRERKKKRHVKSTKALNRPFSKRKKERMGRGAFG